MGKKPKEIKINFFKRVFLSVSSFESYIIYATEKVSKLFVYLLELLIIFSVIVSIPLTYKMEYAIENDEEAFNQVYNQIVERYKLETNKESIVDLIKGNNKVETFFRIYIVTVIVILIMSCFSTFLEVITLSLIGMITTKIAFIPLKYKAVLNMAIASLTLPIIIKTVYLVLNILTGYTINNFQIMYTALSYIYLITSIIILRTELIKKDTENHKVKNKNEAEDN